MFLWRCASCLVAIHRQVTPADFGKLDTIFNKAVKEKQPFVRLEMTKEELKEMFKVHFFNACLLV